MFGTSEWGDDAFKKFFWEKAVRKTGPANLIYTKATSHTIQNHSEETEV